MILLWKPMETWNIFLKCYFCNYSATTRQFRTTFGQNEFGSFFYITKKQHIDIDSLQNFHFLGILNAAPRFYLVCRLQKRPTFELVPRWTCVGVRFIRGGLETQIVSNSVRSEVLTAVRLAILFWVLISYSLVGRHQCFRENTNSIFRTKGLNP
jgi:hypothetical protein